MAIIRWYERPGSGRPGQVLGKLQREMNRLFTDYGTGESPFAAAVFPPVNVSEDGENLYVRAEIPGVELDELEISVEGESMTLRGLRKPLVAEEETCFHRRERESGRFRRILSLPSRVDQENVSAVFKNGVLKVTLPKAKEAIARQIKVSSE
jgi:HSP20 family protein